MRGLAVATLLTLVFLPALYVTWFRIKQPDPQALPEEHQQVRANISQRNPVEAHMTIDPTFLRASVFGVRRRSFTGGSTSRSSPPSTTTAAKIVFSVLPSKLRNRRRFMLISVFLASPGFCRSLDSRCEPECLHLIGVLSFDDEFRRRCCLGAEFRRNSGKLWRIALATTSSEGGTPGLMVRSQEPKEAQTRCGKATASY